MKRILFLSLLGLALYAYGEKPAETLSPDEIILAREFVITFTANGQNYELSKTKDGRPAIFLYDQATQTYTISGGDGAKLYFNLVFKGPFTAGPITDSNLSQTSNIQISLGDASYRYATDRGSSFNINITDVKTVAERYKKANGTFEGTLHDPDKKPLTITNGKFTCF
jgi:hypothetical protein